MRFSMKTPLISKKCVYLTCGYPLFMDISIKLLFFIPFAVSVIEPLGAQPALLNLEQVGELMPEKIEEYKMVGGNKGRMLKIGTLSYTMVERTFVHGKQQVIIMLFDYNNAPVMYRQATLPWKNALSTETALILENAYELERQPGWMRYDKVHNKSQISLGIQNRFYLMLIGEGVSPSALENIVKIFELTRFPPRDVEPTEAKHR